MSMLESLRRSAKPRYECPICGAGFAERTDLNLHAWQRHDGAGRSFRCVDCGQIFASERRLFDHQARAHQSNT
ncbi:MAG TPA: C2H2-type zinc finger protein [Thermomicrobiaceae bacterium]|nr:C2H2-type zinc finger protein [Thermomicrobiaceae bacterium]